jgi:hypothetical protein
VKHVNAKSENKITAKHTTKSEGKTQPSPAPCAATNPGIFADGEVAVACVSLHMFWQKSSQNRWRYGQFQPGNTCYQCKNCMALYLMRPLHPMR